MRCDKRISLDPRLSMIAEMLGVCESCADIGSDHGRLGAFLLQNRRCKRVVMTDISAASLEKARALIALAGLEGAQFCVGDGARALQERVECAVIAGMGGETIAEIIEGADGRLDGARLILQPNVAAPELRRRLCGGGWRIEDEAIARDGRRLYPIIAAVRGAQRLSPEQIEVGPVLLEKRPPALSDCAAFRLRVARKALEGARLGGSAAEIAALEREMEIWEGVRRCL